MDTNKLTFGEKIRTARKQKGLTQKELADMIGAKHNSVSDWEKNKNRPDPDTIELICGVLDITPNYLLSDKTDTDISPEEYELIKKYRSLDDHGKETVDLILGREMIRIEFSNTKKSKGEQNKRVNAYKTLLESKNGLPAPVVMTTNPDTLLHINNKSKRRPRLPGTEMNAARKPEAMKAAIAKYKAEKQNSMQFSED